MRAAVGVGDCRPAAVGETLPDPFAIFGGDLEAVVGDIQ